MFFTLPELRMFLPRKLHQGMDFRHYVNRLPKDAALTVVADSCSSGGLIDQEPVQVGLPYHPRPQKSCHPRILPYDAYLAQLSSKTGLNSPDIGVHLVKLFDSEASILFRLRPDQHPKPLKADQGILLSGCEPDQNTVEDWDENGSPCGAFTKVVVGILKPVQRTSNWLSRQGVFWGSRQKMRGNTRVSTAPERT
ncbi:hypothetical protein ABFS82_11G022000 [Erythranthe guttata]